MSPRIPTCTCAAYPYPHRRYGGKCEGSQVLEHASDDPYVLADYQHEMESGWEGHDHFHLEQEK